MLHNTIKKILIIEDYKDMQESLLDTLSTMTKNSDIRGVATIECALNLLREWLPDMIFLDPGLPLDTNLPLDPALYEEISTKQKFTIDTRRLQVFDWLKALAPHSIYTIITAFADPVEAEIFHQRGAHGYLAKLGLRALDIQSILDDEDNTGFLLRLPHLEYRIVSYRCKYLTKQHSELANKIRQFSNDTPFKTRIENTAEEMNISYETALKYYKNARKILEKHKHPLALELTNLRKKKH